MSKKYNEFMKDIVEASGEITGAIMHPGVRRDLEGFLRAVSVVNHGDMFFDKIDERFAAHGYVIDYTPVDEDADLDEGGEYELKILEVATGRLVDDGNTVLYLMWERLSTRHNPEDANAAVAKEYRVKANLETVVDESSEEPSEVPEHGADFTPTVQ